MTTASKSPFPHPLQLGTLDHFVAPQEDHTYGRARWDDGSVLVGNGYIALRITRGLWDGSDFEPASPEFLSRFSALDWSKFDRITTETEWKRLDDVRGHLYKFAPRALWLGNKLGPSPVWRVADTHLVRLSHLQLIARLPRCEVYTGDSHHESLFFRYNGGVGIIARDKKLHDPIENVRVPFSIFNTRYHFDGTVIKPRVLLDLPAPKPPPEPPIEDWPPAAPTDP